MGWACILTHLLESVLADKTNGQKKPPTINHNQHIYYFIKHIKGPYTSLNAPLFKNYWGIHRINQLDQLNRKTHKRD